MSDQTQRYSIPEDIRLLGPASTHGLLTLAGPHGGIERIAKVLAEIDADADRKTQADELGAMLRASPWHDRDEATVADTNRPIHMSREQLERAASIYTDAGVASVVQAMNTLGVVQTGAILDVVERAQTPKERRERLLGVLAAHPDAVDASTVERLWTMLVPGGELRMQAGELLLTRIGPGEVDRFLRTVSVAKVAGAGYREAMAYGPALLKIAGRDALRPYTKSKVPVIRAIALSAFVDEPATIRAFEDDQAALPPTAEGYSWVCPARQLVHSFAGLAGQAKILSASDPADAPPINLAALANLGSDVLKEEAATVGSFVCQCLDASRCMGETRVY
jgi:hypothetical protein